MEIEFEFADGSSARIRGDDIAGVSIGVRSGGIGSSGSTTTFQVHAAGDTDDERWELADPLPPTAPPASVAGEPAEQSSPAWPFVDEVGRAVAEDAGGGKERPAGVS